MPHDKLRTDQHFATYLAVQYNPLLPTEFLQTIFGYFKFPDLPRCMLVN
jgi:hypothetical protein